MIAALLSHSARYKNLIPGLDQAFEYLHRVARDLPPDGRYEIDGDRVFALVMTYTTAPRVEKVLEGHRRYLDVQYLASGGPEAIYYTPAETAPVAEDYNPDKDFIKFDATAAQSVVVLYPENFAVFFPEDAHQPGTASGVPAQVRKIVVKVRL